MKTYPYRWVVLGAFMLANLAIQILWISYAPITAQAASFYGVKDLQIGFLSMIFMIAFVPLSMPISWLIDRFGLKHSVGIGAGIMALAAIGRGLAGNDFTLVVVATIGLAIAQPFFLNSWTAVAAKWFPHNERATAVGLQTLANLAGIAVGMALTPSLLASFSIPEIQLLWGGIAAFSALAFFVFAREAPPTPPCFEGEDYRILMMDGLKHALKIRDFWLFILVFFLGMGVFNGVLTWIEPIVRDRGFNAQDAGDFGAILLVAGLLGAIILPLISDKLGNRLRFLLLGFALCIPGLMGLAFATDFGLVALSCGVFGFFLAGATPIGMQYAAEVTRPTPEGTSNGVYSLFGQASVVIVYAMEALRGSGGSFTVALVVCGACLAASSVTILFMKEAAATKKAPKREAPSPKVATQEE